MNNINLDPSIPQLVSYPRTGSHWLRMILEQYLEKYCLPTSFYNNTEHWGFHLHDRIVGKGDEGITSGFEKVIYLYRNPIDTIYSQLKYEDLSFYYPENVSKIANEYYIHLNRWLYNSEDCKQVLFIKYEDIKNNHKTILKKVIEFLGYRYNENKINKIFKNLTLERAKTKIEDSKVINKGHFNGEYKKNKEEFINLYKTDINKIFKEIWK